MSKRRGKGPGFRSPKRIGGMIDMVRHQLGRRQLIRLQNYRCPYCIIRLAEIECSIDHVWPTDRNGFDGLGNWLVAHKRCNNKKGNRLPYPCELLYLDNVNRAAGVPTVLTRKELV